MHGLDGSARILSILRRNRGTPSLPTIEIRATAVECRTEVFVKLDTALIPFRAPPFDHSATRRLSPPGNRFSLCCLPITLLQGRSAVRAPCDQIRLCQQILDGTNHNREIPTSWSLLRDKTMKHQGSTLNPVFAYTSSVIGAKSFIVLKLVKFSASQQQAWNIGSTALRMSSVVQCVKQRITRDSGVSTSEN